MRSNERVSLLILTSQSLLPSPLILEVMRVEAALRLILNAKIFPQMVSERAGDKMVRITVVGGVPEDDPENKGKLNSYMIRVSRKDEADELLEQIQKHTQLSHNNSTGSSSSNPQEPTTTATTEAVAAPSSSSESPATSSEPTSG
jgi:hypothetical protein